MPRIVIISYGSEWVSYLIQMIMSWGYTCGRRTAAELPPLSKLDKTTIFVRYTANTSPASLEDVRKMVGAGFTVIAVAGGNRELTKKLSLEAGAVAVLESGSYKAFDLKAAIEAALLQPVA